MQEKILLIDTDYCKMLKGETFLLFLLDLGLAPGPFEGWFRRIYLVTSTGSANFGPPKANWKLERANQTAVRSGCREPTAFLVNFGSCRMRSNVDTFQKFWRIPSWLVLRRSSR